MADTDQLPSISYRDGVSLRVIYTLPPTSNRAQDSVLYFTAPKAGTVMLSNLLGRLAPQVGMQLVYIVGELYQLGILSENAPASTSKIFLPKGYCYGFSEVPKAFEIPLLGRAKSILLVRDPRDMLVSLYYSLRLSHPQPGKSTDAVRDKTTEMPGRSEAQGMDIDRFIVSFVPNYSFIDYREILSTYMLLARSSGVRVFRYEDVVYDKRKWAAEICGHYGWDIPAEMQREAVEQIDVFPDAERPADHVRQVHPGNYKKKLKPDTIRWIEDTWAEEMAFFGYLGDLPA